MENKDLFHSFNYVVGNDFIYQDKVVVKVFYLYKNTNVIKNVDIKKKNNAPESYYKDEAKKIIDQLIKSGELEKYSKLYLKKDKRKKGLAVLIPIASACAIAGITVGTYFAVQPSNSSVDYEITIPEISGVSIDVGDIKPGKDLEATISVNNDDRKDNPQGLPHTLEIKIGDKVLSSDEYTYTLNPGRESATIHIDASKIDGPISFNFTITDLAWYENHYYIDSLTKADITKDGGVIKTLTVNGQQHKVRLIGVDEDYGKIGDESTKIHTTWEFANLISDKDGYSLATQWNDSNDVDDRAGSANHNYLDSSIRMALVGEKQDKGHILWAQKGETTWSTDPLYKNKCVLDMLPSDLVSVLRTPSKYINIYNTTETKWEEKTVEDKLFLLSSKEIGAGGGEPSASTYTYYKGAQGADRVKKQVKDEYYDPFIKINYVSGSGQVYESFVWNSAGFNPSTPGYGGSSWLRSPDQANIHSMANFVDEYGSVTLNYVYSTATSVAPAFCI